MHAHKVCISVRSTFLLEFSQVIEFDRFACQFCIAENRKSSRLIVRNVISRLDFFCAFQVKWP